ncbi:hypothetical protein [uncultured Aquimarina sp.]|uniref:hypothetical protein n=1 Tax=uncultured Aquimarina sp. TaxID=575652 RepID=UPI00261ACFA1|nr:hypothetical protein [uncultured Aquimarina sp.]
MKKIILILTLLKFITSIAQEEAITIANSTTKLSFDQTKEVYYSFAEGDQMIFDFDMVKGKHLKEIEIIELPNNTFFSDYKVSELQNQQIPIRNKGVYKFRFYSSSLTNRVFKYSIKRIPSGPKTKNFNTNWKWKTIRDTTYTKYQQDSLVGYETRKIKRTKKQLVKTDTVIVQPIKNVERVHSETALGKSPYSYIDVNLPKNKYIPNNQNPYESTEIIAWSYWLGVGQKAQEDYKAANKKVSDGLSLIGSLAGYEALTNLAIKGISLFNDTSMGDNVRYRFITQQNGTNKVIHNGNGPSGEGRNTELLQGGFTIELYNDNFRQGIDVNVKIIVVQLRKIWKNIEYEEEIQEPIYVTLDKIRMDIKETSIRIPVE